MSAPHPLRLADLPLWRLLVALDDAERTFGSDSSTARVIAETVRRRLRGEPFATQHAKGEKAVADAR